MSEIKFSNDPAKMPELYEHDGGFFYLAHPFTAATKELMRHNVDHARWVYSNLFLRGVFCYNPLEATYISARDWGWPDEHESYTELNHSFIDCAIGVIVVKCDGWEKSRGIADEIAYAKEIGLPVFYLDMEEFNLETGYGTPADMP